jgi:hypothetical protein
MVAKIAERMNALHEVRWFNWGVLCHGKVLQATGGQYYGALHG